jgi:DUF438 domain-containing protein
MTTYKKKTTVKKKIKRTETCHECIKEFAKKDIYVVDNTSSFFKIEHNIGLCLECLKSNNPDEWEKIKKEQDPIKKSRIKKS